MYFPSGESSAAAISGLPKMISRSISGGTAALFACATAAETTSRRDTKADKSFIGRFLSGPGELGPRELPGRASRDRMWRAATILLYAKRGGKRVRDGPRIVTQSVPERFKGSSCATEAYHFAGVMTIFR